MASVATPSRDEFAAMLDDMFGGADSFEGRVVHGTVTAIENDMAVIDVGLKSEGRVPLREFAAPGQKDFHAGMTLTQAVLAAGGATRRASGRVRAVESAPSVTP